MSQLNLHVEKRTLTYQPPFSDIDSLSRRSSFQLILEGDDHTGLGEAAPMNGWTQSATACEQKLDSLTGTLTDGIDAIKRLEASLETHPTVRHALNQARLDLIGRRTGQPVHTLLSDATPPENSIPVNGLIPNLNALNDELPRAVSEGFRTLKVKTSESPSTTVERVKTAIRDSNSRPEIRIDPNEGWSFDELKPLSEKLQQLPLDYLEQPFDRENLGDHHRCRRYASVALDESLLEHDLDTVLEQQATDAVIVKPHFLGGLDRAVDYIDRLVGNGIKPVVTTAFEGPIGRAGAIQVAASRHNHLPDCGLATGSFVTNAPDWEATLLRDGHLKIPDEPGLGLPETVRDRQW